MSSATRMPPACLKTPRQGTMSASLDLAFHPIAQDVLRKSFAASNLTRDFLEACRQSVSHGEGGDTAWLVPGPPGGRLPRHAEARMAVLPPDRRQRPRRTRRGRACGSYCAGVAHGDLGGWPAGGLPLPRAGAGRAPPAAIVLVLVPAPPALMATFTASSIGSLKGTSIRSRPWS
jgi:hypothetical protein